MSKTPEEIEAEIAAQREQLADTVDQLSAKLDVKANVKAKTMTADGKPRPEALAAAGSLAAMLVVLVVWKVRRHS